MSLLNYTIRIPFFFILILVTNYSPYSQADISRKFEIIIDFSHKNNKNIIIWQVIEKKVLTTSEVLIHKKGKPFTQDSIWSFSKSNTKTLLKYFFDQRDQITRKIYIRSKIIIGEINQAVVEIEYLNNIPHQKATSQIFKMLLPYGEKISLTRSISLITGQNPQSYQDTIKLTALAFDAT